MRQILDKDQKFKYRCCIIKSKKSGKTLYHQQKKQEKLFLDQTPICRFCVKHQKGKPVCDLFKSSNRVKQVLKMQNKRMIGFLGAFLIFQKGKSDFVISVFFFGFLALSWVSKGLQLEVRAC